MNNAIITYLCQQLDEQTTKTTQLLLEIAVTPTEIEAARDESNKYAFALAQAYQPIQR